jgi:hypothetical protein
MSLWIVDWHDAVTATPISVMEYIYSHECATAAGSNYVVGYDLEHSTVVKIAPDQRCSVENFATFVTAITTIGASVIFVVDFHDIFICKASEFPAHARYMRSERESICRVLADSAIGVLVIVAKPGIMRIVSLLDGR